MQSNETTYKIFYFDYDRVSVPLTLTLFILLIAFLRILHRNLKNYMKYDGKIRKLTINLQNDYLFEKRIRKSWKIRIFQYFDNSMRVFYVIFRGIPESCLLILVGIIFGLVLPHTDAHHTVLKFADILLWFLGGLRRKQKKNISVTDFLFVR